MLITKKSKQITKKTALFEFSHGHKRAVLSAEQVARLAGVTTKTAERWSRGVQIPHPSVSELLRLRACGRVLPDTWHDVYINDTGLLQLPDGRELHPNSYIALDMLRDVINARENEIRQLRAKLQQCTEINYHF